MEREGSGRRRRGINIERLSIVIGCLFVILILGLVSATLHYVIQLSNNAITPSDNVMTSEQFLRSLPLPVRFPGYFRSPDEQKLAEDRLASRTFVPAPNGTVDGLVNTCSGVCYKPTDWRPIRINTLYHACCVSNSYYVSPTWVITIYGKNKTLATFGGTKQYFVKEDCTQLTDCTTCQCQTTTTYESAVVYTDNKTDYEIAWFSTPGCCKCMNNKQMERGVRRVTGSNVNKIFAIVCCLFALFILGLVPATLHYVIQICRNNTNHSLPTPTKSGETSAEFLRNFHLWTRFPKYFRSSSEEKLVQKMFLNNSLVVSLNSSVDRLVHKCNGTCYKSRERTQIYVGVTYHACCMSIGYFKYYNWLTDTNGKNRTLATFDGLMQFFYAEDCLQMDGCTACKCQSQDSYVTAVVQNDAKSGYAIAWFKLRGPCKCINGLFI
ncbi:hypothetical protein ACJMK2_013394 [Sinanodonta woodiana]|uniref:Uncharacterized protein n=1 Tax=Sinanodonta woodiana TaxID=1069815 RepID=A0ABD3UZF5_SINWO